MKTVFWLSLLLITALVLAGCLPVGQTIQPTQDISVLPSTNLPTIVTVSPTSTQTPMITDTYLPTATQTLQVTLEPESILETMQPLLQDPMDCVGPCFWGVTPGKTSIDEVRVFFSPLSLKHKEGTDPNSGKYVYSVGYESNIGRDSSVTFYTSDHIVESIEVTPEITDQKEGSPREWIAYSPETLIKKYGQPSRVEFGLDSQELVTINMIMYYDDLKLIALYSGVDNTTQLCPFTFPFNHVRLWMGANPPYPPLFPTVPLEKATSLTIDQFTQIMLGDPQKACFSLNEKAFQ